MRYLEGAELSAVRFVDNLVQTEKCKQCHGLIAIGGVCRWCVEVEECGA